MVIRAGIQHRVQLSLFIRSKDPITVEREESLRITIGTTSPTSLGRTLSRSNHRTIRIQVSHLLRRSLDSSKPEVMMSALITNEKGTSKRAEFLKSLMTAGIVTHSFGKVMKNANDTMYPECITGYYYTQKVTSNKFK